MTNRIQGRVVGGLVRSSIRDGGQTLFDDLVVGTVVVAQVYALTKSSHHNLRKKRPVVLIAPKGEDTSWLASAITTNSSYQEGSSRVAINQWHTAGLNRPSYFWGNPFFRTSDDCILKKLGNLSIEDAIALVRLVNMHPHLAEPFLSSVEKLNTR